MQKNTQTSVTSPGGEFRIASNPTTPMLAMVTTKFATKAASMKTSQKASHGRPDFGEDTSKNAGALSFVGTSQLPLQRPPKIASRAPPTILANIMLIQCSTPWARQLGLMLRAWNETTSTLSMPISNEVVVVRMGKKNYKVIFMSVTKRKDARREQSKCRVDQEIHKIRISCTQAQVSMDITILDVRGDKKQYGSGIRLPTSAVLICLRYPESPKAFKAKIQNLSKDLAVLLRRTF